MADEARVLLSLAEVIEAFGGEEAWAQAFADAEAADEAVRQADEYVFSGAADEAVWQHDDAVREQAMLDLVVFHRQLRGVLPRRHLTGGGRSRRRRQRRNVRSGSRRARAPDDPDLDLARIGGGS
jgi:hypothetical protein